MSQNPQSIKPPKLTHNIILLLKIKSLIKKWKKKTKNSRHRKNVLNQWIQTQRNYIKDLKIVVVKIKTPIQRNNLLDQNQICTIFPSIDVIIELSQKLLQDLQKFQKNWNPNVTLIAPSLLKIYNFIKIYKDYCNNFCRGQAIMKTIKENPVMIDIQKCLPMDIQSYLIKPIQRPPKYMLLLKDYQNHMSSSHPDYQNLTLAIRKYHQVNQINNQSMQKELRHQRIFQLSKLYKDLLTSTRQYIRQFECFQYQNNVKIYIFNDLVITTFYNQVSQTLHKIIHIDPFSFCYKNQNGKYFMNKLFICGKNDSVHLMFFSQNKLNQVYQSISQVIQNIYKKQQARRSMLSTYQLNTKIPRKVQVTIAQIKSKSLMVFQSNLKIITKGTDVRSISILSNQTIYIIQLCLSKPWNLSQNIFIEYKKIQEINNVLIKKYPNLIFPSLMPLKDISLYDQKKKGTKVIQLRCLIIEEYLNFIFRNPVLMTYPDYINFFFNIEANLWKFATQNLVHNCYCNQCKCKINITLNEFINKRIQNLKYLKNTTSSKPQYCISKYVKDINILLQTNNKQFDSYDKILIWLNLKLNRIDYSMLTNRNKQEGQFQIKIYLPSIDSAYVSIKITKQNTVGEVLDKICSQFGISLMNEFGLFLQYPKGSRLLDNDQILYSTIKYLEENLKQKSAKSFFKKIFHSQQKQTIGQKSQIYLKKYLFLTPELEYVQYINNMKKFKLVIDQALFYIHHELIKVNQFQIIQIVALYICIIQAQRLQFITKAHFPVQKIKKILPKSKSSLSENKKWIQQILKVIDQNKQHILKSNNKYQTMFELILLIIRQKISWHTLFFQVQNYQPNSLGGKKNVKIGINYKNVLLTDKQNDGVIVKIPMQQVNYFISGKSIYFMTEDIKYRFDGLMLNNIGQIIDKYRILRKNFPNHFKD